MTHANSMSTWAAQKILKLQSWRAANVYCQKVTCLAKKKPWLRGQMEGAPCEVYDPTSHDYSVTDPVVEIYSFQRNTICLPPDIAFQVHLLSQMTTHRGNDLNMLNEVIWGVKAHAIHYNMDCTTLQILSRKQLVQLLVKLGRWDLCLGGTVGRGTALKYSSSTALQHTDQDPF
jgi:hypothetical protein